MGIGGGVYNYAVKDPVSGLYLVHDGPLVVGLEHFHFYALFPADLLHQFYQGFVVLLAINVRFSHAQQVQIGPVYNKYLHPSASSIWARVSSILPLLSAFRSAKRAYMGWR